MADDPQTLILEQEGRVAILRLNRPEALNALNQQVMTEVVARIGAGDVDGAKGAMEHHLGHLEARLDLDDDRSRDVDLREIFG